VINFSIVIPIYNESKNIKNLIIEIYKSLSEYKNFELIIVNDGSTDDTNEVLKKIQNIYPIKIQNNNLNKGQSFSIWSGIKNSKYNIIVTLDGDGQNNPRDITKLLNIYIGRKKFSLVGGIRTKRKDNIIKIFSSKIANLIRSKVLKDGCIDTGCSLKVFDKDIFLTFPFFDGIHRFLPALYRGYGKNTYFIDVDHRFRISGVSKYGTMDRLFRGIRDLIIVLIILKKYKKR